MTQCNRCKRRVLSHAASLVCDCCKRKTHLNCLAYVNKSDSIYVNRTSLIWFCVNCIQSALPFNHIVDDDEFIQALSEAWFIEPLLPIENIYGQNKSFVPFELNVNDNLPIYDVDPDIQFYQSVCNNSLNNCDYYQEDSFNRKIDNLKIGPGSFSMFHVNIRSIPKNLNNLLCYLETLSHKFTVIGLSESWLKEENFELFNIPGYNAEHNYRPIRAGGGVSMYINEDVEYSVRSDLCLMNSYIECVFIEIDKDILQKDNNAIFGVLYRPQELPSIYSMGT